MDINFRKYYSKLLLFGEYTVLSGSDALVIPYNKYFGEWRKADETEERLKAFFDFVTETEIEGARLNHQLLNSVIEEGVVFKSNIVEGYGIGSSGALSAATLDSFFELDDDLTIEGKRDILAQIESYFHGKSSGTDALAIYENRNLLLRSRNFEFVDFADQKLLKSLFLYDSGKARKTENLVRHYLEDIVKNESSKPQLKELITQNKLAIESCLSGDHQAFKSHFFKLSALQFKLFDKMILPDLKNEWKKGLDNREYAFKLLGAGGGGYYLVYGKPER